jgi:hypothetical protein
LVDLLEDRPFGLIRDHDLSIDLTPDLPLDLHIDLTPDLPPDPPLDDLMIDLPIDLIPDLRINTHRLISLKTGLQTCLKT